MIADTVFIVDLIRGRKKAWAKLQVLARRGISVDLTAITIFELWSGLSLVKDYKKEHKKVLEVISQKRILDFGTKSAKVAGEIDAKLKNKGLKIGTMDTMIAGIALTHNAKLLTRNIKHFSLIPRLKLEKY